MTFGDLKQKVANYLHRDDLASEIPDFINTAMRRLEFNYDWRCMETYTNIQTNTDIAIPERFKNIKFITVKSGSIYHRLMPIEESEAFMLYPDGLTGRPNSYAVSRSRGYILLRPVPDSNYYFYFVYRRFTQELLSDIDTNWWTDNAWELLLYGALLEAEPYIINDNRIIVWKQLRDTLLTDLLALEKEQTIGDRPIIGKSTITNF